MAGAPLPLMGGQKGGRGLGWGGVQPGVCFKFHPRRGAGGAPPPPQAPPPPSSALRQLGPRVLGTVFSDRKARVKECSVIAPRLPWMVCPGESSSAFLDWPLWTGLPRAPLYQSPLPSAGGLSGPPPPPALLCGSEVPQARGMPHGVPTRGGSHGTTEDPKCVRDDFWPNRNRELPWTPKRRC